MPISDGDLAKLRTALAAKRDLAIELERDLTAAPAIGPQNGGVGEGEKARRLAAWLPRLGLPEATDHPAPDPRVPDGRRPNLCVRLPGRSAQPAGGTLWIMTHLDVVPPGERSLWTGDPWTLRVLGDRIVGRGVEDNQQSLVASLLAAVVLRELGLRPAREVGLLFVSDEETGSEHGIGHVLAHAGLFRDGDLALVPDSGSPDGGQVEIAEKSLLWLKLVTRGRQCHASRPAKGVNAFLAGSHLVVRLAAGLAAGYPATDPLFDPPGSTFTPTRKDANVPNINTLPGEDVFYLDCRILPTVDVDEVLARVRSTADGVQREFGVRVDVEIVQRSSSPPTSADSPIVRSLARAIGRVHGVEARTVGIGGGTVGAFLRRRGIPTAVWSRVEETAHQPDESCLLSNLLGDAAVMALLMLGE